MNEKTSLKVKVQKLGTSLSNMVMPNIGAFIAWGVLTALFIKTGWLPNKDLNNLVDPTIKYLLPLLIGYTGGHMVHGQRGAVVGSIATMGTIVGASVPMFIGAMIMGPLGGWCIKVFDKYFKDKIPTGFEMLVNNFSAGLIGFVLIIFAYLGVGPVVSSLTTALGQGVQFIVDVKLLPLANIIVEPAKVLFLNNAINHGIFTPLGGTQVKEFGQSILFLIEANPGPGLGILLAYGFFGKGASKSSAWGASIIHFLGGIHEIYFPYVMMKPLMFLAAIAGGVAGTFTFETLGAGLTGAASPGSIIAIFGMAAKGSHLAVLAGVLVGAVVSFLVASIILKADHSEEGDELAEAQAATKAAKAVAKGQAVEGTAPVAASGEISSASIDQIIFACDAGMGSSAMGASILRDKVKKAGLDIPVTNKAISNLEDIDRTLIVTQQELTPRAQQRTPRAAHVSVDNFLASPKYDEIVALLGAAPAKDSASTPAGESQSTSVELSEVQQVVFAFDKGRGSATMGVETLKAIFKAQGVTVPVTKASLADLAEVNVPTTLLVTTVGNQTAVAKAAPQAQLLVVDSLVTTAEYSKLAKTLSK